MDTRFQSVRTFRGQDARSREAAKSGLSAGKGLSAVKMRQNFQRTPRVY